MLKATSWILCLFTLLCLFFIIFFQNKEAVLPVLYKGRIRPIEAVYAENRTEIDTTAQKLSRPPLEAYNEIAGKELAKAHGKSLYYPTILQLKAEKFYVQYPLIPFVIFAYFLAFIAFLIWEKFGWLIFIFAFAAHTFILLLRCYILSRPPVASMFETLLYVPWISSMTVLIFRKKLAACPIALFSAAILAIAHFSYGSYELETLSAVLDSKFWLSTHVVMVVSSFGLFAFSSLVSHLYLFFVLQSKQNVETMRTLNFMILQSLYLGVACLIPGTILGGVWAAESWGRFWDWDPKESWAFISSCVYLMWIHAYRFRHIRNLGLAFGSIIGFLIISFTWYGVNYILGQGLHSYGFGSGGEMYYYSFLVFELLFLSITGFIAYKKNEIYE